MKRYRIKKLPKVMEQFGIAHKRNFCGFGGIWLIMDLMEMKVGRMQ